MDFPLVWVLILCAVCISSTFPWVADSAPIKVDFSYCQTASLPIFAQNPTPPDPPFLHQYCCPPKNTTPIVDGILPPTTDFLRVRNASQCTDAAYKKKLKKAYALMRALPEDDPRSLTQQWWVHCAYCGGAYLTSNGSGAPQGVDIHFSWLFFPWHRYYLYFHERILQSLLGDPTFSLNYWNWDNPYTIGDGSSKDGACLKTGNNFPSPYNEEGSSTFDSNRSLAALGKRPLRFPDLAFNGLLPPDQQLLYNASAEVLTESNLNVMYEAVVSGGTTAETFMGHPYRAGDIQPDGVGVLGLGGGALELSAHASVHTWTGRGAEFPVNADVHDDMGTLVHAARDPVFFAHHSNIDRLLDVWKSLGPELSQDREYWSDPDFLNAEFLFYDENKDLRRVKVKDCLDSKALGYVYQETIIPWVNITQTRCSNLSYSDLIAQAESLPPPTPDSKGYYNLTAGTPFIIIIDRPANPHGLEEFLTIDGIKLDRSRNAGFDVYVDLLNPDKHPHLATCAEYSGRFSNMAVRREVTGKALVWKQSITRTLVDIQAPEPPSHLVITLLPFSKKGGYETVEFKSITVDT